MIVLWRKRSKSALWLLVFLFFVMLGAGRAEDNRVKWEQREMTCANLEGRYVEMTGRVEAVAEDDSGITVRMKGNRVQTFGKNGMSAEVWEIPCVDAAFQEVSGTSLKDGSDEQVYSRSFSAAEPGNDLRGDIGIGMTVCVRGDLELFSEARNPGEFDFRKYNRALGIDCRIRGESLTVLDSHKKPLPELLRRIRAAGKRGILSASKEEDAGIFCAAVLGDKKKLAEEIKDLYQKNGIAHLLAISGLHLSLIGMGIYKLLRRAGAGYGRAGLAGTCFIVCYGLMVGGSASVARAVIMMAAAFLAACLGRTYDLLSAVSLALILAVWKSPELLAEGGVQLSFGAVFSIGVLAPVIRPADGKKRRWAEAAAVSLGIQIGTLPIVLYHFYQFPLYGIFLNLVVVPLMGVVVCSGIGAAIFGNIWIPAGTAAAGPGHVILKLYEKLCQMTMQLPAHELVWGRPNLGRIAVYYVVLLAGVIMIIMIKEAAGRRQVRENGSVSGKYAGRGSEDGRKQKPGKVSGGKNVPGACLKIHSRHLHAPQLTESNFQTRSGALYPLILFLTCAVCICLMIPRPVRGLEAVFLDVGQGDGILLRTGRKAILIDGGSTSEKSLGKYRLEPCLKSYGISKLDYAFVSHGDQDHISGVKYLLDSCGEVKIENLVVSCQGKEDETLDSLAISAQNRGTKVREVTAGDRFSVEGLTLTCLYPGPGDIPGDKNEESEVLKADYGNCHILFTGDMSGAGEARLLEKQRDGGAAGELSDIQILKTAHHGSRFSSTETFLDALAVRWAVISYAEGNSYGHPHKEVLERLESRGVKIYGTAQYGAVMMHSDGERVVWKGFLDE